MTEIPEHLLRRSKERRAALGQGGEGGGDDAPAEASAPAESSSAPAPAASASTPAPAAAPAEAPAVIDEPPSPVLLADVATQRSKIPIWAVPVLVLLPFWAVLYAGAFGERGHEEEVVSGAQVYATNCAACHGANGEGATGPALAGGETKKTFPEEADHATWVREGSIGKAKGTPYGDAGREGGQRTIQQAGMPGFAATLTPAEINAVVQFEREEL